MTKYNKGSNPRHQAKLCFEVINSEIAKGEREKQKKSNIVYSYEKWIYDFGEFLYNYSVVRDFEMIKNILTDKNANGDNVFWQLFDESIVTDNIDINDIKNKVNSLVVSLSNKPEKITSLKNGWEHSKRLEKIELDKQASNRSR